MTRITLASNNAEIGGGEVMLLALAESLRELDHDVRIVVPAGDHKSIGAESTRRGFPTTAILGEGRRDYMRGLRAWDAAERTGVLWCNGHVPALATIGRPERIVHLHQAPTWKHVVAGRLAAAGSLALLVPSASMASDFPGAQILPNWVPEVERIERTPPAPGEPIVLGFLGRLSPDKGVCVLAKALAELDRHHPGAYRLLIAGEPRFVTDHERREVEAALAPIAHLVDRPGWMDRGNFFSAVDLAVFPSVWAEPFGLIVAEAMSARVPFIISDAGALPEVAGPAHPWICAANDAQDLVRVIETAARAATTTASVLDVSHARWAERFSPAAGLKRLRFLLTDVLPAEEAA